MKDVLTNIFMILIFLFVGCSSYSDDGGGYPSYREDVDIAGWQTITAEEAYLIMAEADNFIILDVRTAAEFQMSRIDGAILLPYDELILRAEDELPDTNAIILIYCRSGNRSRTAASTLVSLGYTAVYDFGGIINWPFDTISG